MLDATYWFSVEELQFLAACCRVGVYVYRFHEGEAAEAGDAYNFVLIGDDLYGDLLEMDELVHVTFESSEPNTSRGHFSRLWAHEDWLDPRSRRKRTYR